MTPVLRDYQTDCLEAIEAAWADMRRPAVLLPTGAGKTVIFAELCRRLVADGQRPAILCNRDELVRQTVEKLKAVDPNLVVGVIQASRNETRGHVVVASVQTLSRQNRLDKIKPERFTHLIADECHYSAAPSWRRVLDHFDCRAVGFTATMSRTDSKGLGEVWETIVYEKDLWWMIERGYLVRPEGVTVSLPALDLGKVRTSKGDYQEGDLGRAMSEAGAGKLMAEAYLEHAMGPDGIVRRGIVFTPLVENAVEWLEDFRAAGIPTELITGETPTEERQAKYAATRIGTNRVLMSVMVLTTGFDLPAMEVAVVARCTKAKGLYRQMAGRVLRPSPETGKTSALLIDVTGTRHLGLSNIADLSLDKPPAPRDEFEYATGGGGPAQIDMLKQILPPGVKFLIFDPISGDETLALNAEGLIPKADTDDVWVQGYSPVDGQQVIDKQRRSAMRHRYQKMWDGITTADGDIIGFLPASPNFPYWTFITQENGTWSVGRFPQKAGKVERVAEGHTFVEASLIAMNGHEGPSTRNEGMLTESQERFLVQLRVEVTPEMLDQSHGRWVASRAINRKLFQKRVA